MNYFVNTPLINMRLYKESQAEMSSQALFSEEIKILSKQGDWCEVETLVDGYKGFIHCKEGDLISKELSPYQDQERDFVITSRISTHVYKEADTIFGSKLTLPFGSKLQVFKPIEKDARWILVILPDGSIAYIQSGDVEFKKTKLNLNEICQLSSKFLGIPYTWGGKSSFGFDCSGFVQMLYSQMGLKLPRDSKDQFASEMLQDKDINDLEPGDLIFYGDHNHAIKHVGLSLGNKRFIHTSAVTENMPYVRVSTVEDSAWNGSGYYPKLFGKTLKL